LIFDFNKLKNGNSSYINVALNKITKVISNSLINKISNYLTDEINNNKDIKNIMKNIENNEKELFNFFFSNIYSIRISPTADIIYLSYFS